MPPVKSLFTLEFKSIATGYKLVSSLLQKFDLQTIEVFSQSPGKLVCLFETTDNLKSDLQKQANSLKKYLIDWSMTDYRQDLLDAFYGHKKTAGTESLLITEVQSLSYAFLLAEKIRTLVSTELIEIDSGRALDGKVISYFSVNINDSLKLKKLFKKQRSKMFLNAEIISPIPDPLKDHWNLNL